MDFLTPKQAAIKICVSLSLIYQLLKKRKLPAIRVGVRGKGKWLIAPADLDGFLSSCKLEDLKLEEGGLKFLK